MKVTIATTLDAAAGAWWTAARAAKRAPRELRALPVVTAELKLDQ